MKYKVQIPEFKVIQWTGLNLDEVLKFIGNYDYVLKEEPHLIVSVNRKRLRIPNNDYVAIINNKVTVCPIELINEAINISELIEKEDSHE